MTDPTIRPPAIITTSLREGDSEEVERTRGRKKKISKIATLHRHTRHYAKSGLMNKVWECVCVCDRSNASSRHWKMTCLSSPGLYLPSNLPLKKTQPMTVCIAPSLQSPTHLFFNYVMRVYTCVSRHRIGVLLADTVDGAWKRNYGHGFSMERLPWETLGDRVSHERYKYF